MTKFEITKPILNILFRKNILKENLNCFACSSGSNLFLWKKQGSVCSGAGRPDKLGDPGLCGHIDMESEKRIVIKIHQQGY